MDDESLSAVSQSTAQLNWPVFVSHSIDRPPLPINMTADHKKTGDIGESAFQVVKESSLKVVARVSDAFPPLKTTAAGLVETSNQHYFPPSVPNRVRCDRPS